MRALAVSIIFALCLPGCGGRPQGSVVAVESGASSSQSNADPLRFIDDCEDRRTYTPLLDELAGSEWDLVRERLALALGRIGDPAGSKVLAGLLKDREPSVRRAAAFAAGLFGKAATDELRTAVLTPLATSGEPGEIAALLSALGEIGGPQDVARIAVYLSDNRPALAANAARSLGMLGLRGVVVDPAVLSGLQNALSATDMELRREAAFALGRIAKVETLAPAVVAALTTAASGDSEVEVRILALRALTKWGGLDKTRLEKALKDPDREVAAMAAFAIRFAPEALRCGLAESALTIFAGQITADAALVNGTFSHAVRAALEAAFAGHCSSPLVVTDAKTIIRALAPTPEARTASVALVTCLALAVAGDEDLRLMACDPQRSDTGKRLLIQRLQSRAATSQEALSTLIGMTHEASFSVSVAALAALAEVNTPAAHQAIFAAIKQETTTPLYTAAALDALAVAAPRLVEASRQQPEQVKQALAVVGNAVSRYQSSSTAHAVLLSAAGALAELKSAGAAPILDALAADTRPEVRTQALASLGILKLPPPGTLPPLQPVHPSSHEDRETWRATKLSFKVETTRGAFSMQLDGALAPATVASFAALAEDHYFDNTPIHRVVPTFVVQAGDPSGTGMGDPGYSLRCEYNPTPYVRGTVGMALSGKDTGGSQFFVTLTRQPHLDGHYTVFGAVTAGMSVLEVIEEGDSILKVTKQPAQK